MKYDLCFLIVLYDKEVNDSETYRKLIDNLSNLETFLEIKIVVWNNGPHKLVEGVAENSLVDVVLIERVDNEKLSTVYNTVLEQFKSERYVILDDDSDLSHEYLSDIICSNKEHLLVPKTVCNGVVISPTLTDKRTTQYINEGISNKCFIAIGSGIVIPKKLALRIKEIHGDVFDERFSFYGVDTSFFYRFSGVRKEFVTQVIRGFEHSLSTLATDESVSNKWRKYQASKSLALKTKYYFRKDTLKLVIKVIFRTIMKREKDYDLKTIVKEWLR